LFIYIDEAHACDEWPLGTHSLTKKHVTIEDRIAAAKEFLEKTKFPFPTVVDTIQNDFNEKFAVWPERYYIFQRDETSVIGMPTDRGYVRAEMKVMLENHFVKEKSRAEFAYSMTRVQDSHVDATHAREQQEKFI